MTSLTDLAVTIDDIRAAAGRIESSVVRTPCTKSSAFSQVAGAEVFFKHDHLQSTGSFKERGARNTLMLLTAEQKASGVIAASAGNHALALAHHGRELGIAVTVVMPKFAPLTKMVKCGGLGANVIQHGESFDDARAYALELTRDLHLTYIHGFDNPHIIAGAGTVALEMLQDVSQFDAILIPVGGGGLLAGMAVAIRTISPGTKIIGVETEHAPTLHASLGAKKIVRIDARPTLADGLAIAEPGKLCFDIATQLVDEVLLVDESHIARAVLQLLELERTLVEGAGAAACAAVLQFAARWKGQRIGVVLCGSNIDLSMLGRLIDRGLAADGRLCRMKCAISDRPGGLARLTALIAQTGASIREIDHDRNFASPDVASVVVNIVLEIRDRNHAEELKTHLAAHAIRVVE